MQCLLQPSCWWVNRILPYLFSAVLRLAAHQARKEGHPPTVTTAQINTSSPLWQGPAQPWAFSFVQLVVSAHSEGAPFGKGTRAAGQKNPVGDTDVSRCQGTNSWTNTLTSHRTPGSEAQIQAHDTLHCVCVGTGKARAGSASSTVLHLTITSRASSSRPNHRLFFQFSSVKSQ